MDPLPLRPSAPRPPAVPSAPQPRTPTQSSFSRVLEQVAARLDHGERLVDQALAQSRSSDAGRLLSLQAGIYRYTETVELASKVVERSSSAVRTVLQGQ